MPAARSAPLPLVGQQSEYPRQSDGTVGTTSRSLSASYTGVAPRPPSGVAGRLPRLLALLAAGRKDEMSLAATHFDLVLGIDTHVVLMPSPAGPVPTPVLLPFVGLVFDPLDYVPGIGATVWINGRPRAQAGSAVKACVPHQACGAVFLKPPANEGEVFTGSSTVACEGEPLASDGSRVLSCQDIGFKAPERFGKVHVTWSMVLPTSLLLAIPSDCTVLVGGDPTISFGALATRAEDALMDAASNERKRRAEKRADTLAPANAPSPSRIRRVRAWLGRTAWRYGRAAAHRVYGILSK